MPDAPAGVPGPPSPYVVRVPPRLPWILAAVVTALLVAHVALQTAHYAAPGAGAAGAAKDDASYLLRDLFDVDLENNVPSWYSSAALLLASGLLLSVAGARKREGDPQARRWLGIAVIFALLSLDESAGLHEALNTWADRAAGDEGNRWEVAGAAAVAAFALLHVRWWISLPPRTRLLFGIAGAGYVAGALGVEHLSFPVPEDTLRYNLLTAAEEGLEMYSIVLFVHALLDHMWTPSPGAVAVGVDVRPPA